jgi:tetratricopeptide (TPR) repeat protein
MSAASAPVCFVVMPFGQKPMNGGNGTTAYDFDKVYRIIIQRAVQQAGLCAVRADERVSSALIHTDMFKDLRDQPVVLADLSLENPNVFYELGVRHVMSATGTVLMCRKGSALPFDVRLSRVIFYAFDGTSLDWEEVERVVQVLQLALQEARQGRPDSPVHALLEPVIRAAENGGIRRARSREASEGRLSRYERLIAQHWISQGKPFGEISAYRTDVFGCRALGYYCLDCSALPQESEDVARLLQDMEQFGLAVELFELVKASGTLSDLGQQIYATACSEAQPNIAGADEAIRLTQEVLRRLEQRYADVSSPDALRALADCHRRLAGLQQWRWQLTKDPADLETALAGLGDAARLLDDARAQGAWSRPGIVAQVHFKHMLLLRLRDGNPERADAERNLDAIMTLEKRPTDAADGVSWLHWFQAIALADAGSGDQAQRLALQTAIEDAALKQNVEFWQIGRWQYRNLRRFIEQQSQALRNPATVGLIAQVLQAAEDAP